MNWTTGGLTNAYTLMIPWKTNIYEMQKLLDGSSDYFQFDLLSYRGKSKIFSDKWFKKIEETSSQNIYTSFHSDRLNSFEVYQPQTVYQHLFL